MGFGAFATATGLPRGAHRRRRRIVELGATPPNGVRGHSDRRRDHPHPTWAEFTSLRAQPQPSLTLVQMRPQSLEPTRQRVHRNGHSRNRSAAQPNERLFHREPLVAAGALTPALERTYPLEEAADALQRLTEARVR